jgi:hypothetical protein
MRSTTYSYLVTGRTCHRYRRRNPIQLRPLRPLQTQHPPHPPQCKRRTLPSNRPRRNHSRPHRPNPQKPPDPPYDPPRIHERLSRRRCGVPTRDDPYHQPASRRRDKIQVLYTAGGDGVVGYYVFVRGECTDVVWRRFGEGEEESREAGERGGECSV